MKLYKTLAFSFLLLAFSVIGAAQTALTHTTLSSAVTSTTNTFIVASATGISAGTNLYVIDFHSVLGELVVVRSVSGTTLTVTRGSGFQRAHTSGSRVVIAPIPSAFYTRNPKGACTAADTLYTPWINTVTGEQWLCSTVTLSWVPGFASQVTTVGPTATVASTAGLITPSGPLFTVSGTAAITGFTQPIGYQGGNFCIIPSGIFTTTTANNIALASTAVVNRQLCYTYNVNTNKFIPSY
jgi:hypothetical protein